MTGYAIHFLLSHLLIMTTSDNGAHGETSLASGNLRKIYSNKERLGNGNIRNYIIFNGIKPVEYGTEIDEAVVKKAGKKFPAEDAPLSDGKYDIRDKNGDIQWPCCGFESEFQDLIKRPERRSRLLKDVPFTHFVSNYNPAGHGPPGIYMVRHFDLHWYMVSREERMSLAPPTFWEESCGVVRGLPYPSPVTCTDFDLLMTDIPSDQISANYCLPAPGATAEPVIGAHL